LQGPGDLTAQGSTNRFAAAAQLRSEQRMEEALGELEKMARADPRDARAAFGFAQLSFECWRPAAELFAAARRLAPDQPDLARNHALALTAEGEAAAAEAMLDGLLARHPLWLDGHRTLANLRVTHGESAVADASYARACSAQPDNASLRLAWFQHHAILKAWVKAKAVLDGAAPEIEATDSFRMARLFARSESGDDTLEEADFEAFAGRGDPGFDLCRLRFHLRRGEAGKVEPIAKRHGGGAGARSFWPYLTLAWRMLGDARAGWLDGEPLFAKGIDLDFQESELDELAVVLRRLHRMKAPYPEQSVRGGTQTDRQLFFHPDPAIQKVRARLSQAVAAYISMLPEPVHGHPLLGHQRGPIRFEGSWSVRLAGSGFHVSHTHNLGWISSALYVALPADMGDEPDGWLSLGKPPPEFNLDLAPYTQVQPKPGRLVLFPSTLWHATEPFGDGERLTIAFDVAIPPVIPA
jgi:Tfp pilus assembly protein PilF